MKLHHTVNHTLKGITESIEANGLVPQVADTYSDLVPEKIRHLPVVWLSEGIWQGGLPVYEVDSGKLDKNKLYPNAIVYECDGKLNWWVYQGNIPANILVRIGGEI